jgi:hypothetical protein
MDTPTIKPGEPVEAPLDAHLVACLDELTLRESPRQPISVRGGGKAWDAPFDLRVRAPHATDLRDLWRAASAPLPAALAAILGPKRPILLTHSVTPFPQDSAPPARVWQLSYEFVPSIDTTRTWAVLPGSELVRVGKVGQSVGFGINAQGKVSAREPLDGPGYGIRLSTRQEFVLEASLELTLRKIVGAAVGTGGRCGRCIGRTNVWTENILYFRSFLSLRT